MSVKGLVAGIVRFLTQQLEEGDITADSRESLEVAIQCIESAYNVQAGDAPSNFDLYEAYKSVAEKSKPEAKEETGEEAKEEASEEAKEEAKRWKNEGNEFMKAKNYQQAVSSYTKAINLDGKDAVYYCNRAAAYNKMKNYTQAIKDCEKAISIDPAYSKAYSRLGLAFSKLERHKEAKECYRKALDIEPDNESYRTNLQLAEEKAQQSTSRDAHLNLAGVDISPFLINPVMMTAARQMWSDPVVQNMVQSIMSSDNETRDSVEVLLEASEHLAQQMQTHSPELVESLRRQMNGNQNDPKPPKQN